jgi:hypothetical protein
MSQEIQMADVEPPLSRSTTDAIVGVELDPDLVDRARGGTLARHRRRHWLQTGATVGVLIAALIAGAVMFAQRSSVAHSVQGGNVPAARAGDVTVPTLEAGTDILAVYRQLHRLGFRVELTQQTDIWSLGEPGATLAPAAGTRVPRGSVIQITPVGTADGSPAVSKSNPHYRVPKFGGKTLSVAIRWANRHGMFWSIPKLPALPASRAKHLFDAYRIVGQQPKPHHLIGQGVLSGGGYRVTPLTLRVVAKPTR